MEAGYRLFWGLSNCGIDSSYGFWGFTQKSMLRKYGNTCCQFGSSPDVKLLAHIFVSPRGLHASRYLTVKTTCFCAACICVILKKSGSKIYAPYGGILVHARGCTRATRMYTCSLGRVCPTRTYATRVYVIMRTCVCIGVPLHVFYMLWTHLCSGYACGVCEREQEHRRTCVCMECMLCAW